MCRPIIRTGPAGRSGPPRMRRRVFPPRCSGEPPVSQRQGVRIRIRIQLRIRMRRRIQIVNHAGCGDAHGDTAACLLVHVAPERAKPSDDPRHREPLHLRTGQHAIDATRLLPASDLEDRKDALAEVPANLPVTGAGPESILSALVAFPFRSVRFGWGSPLIRGCFVCSSSSSCLLVWPH